MINFSFINKLKLNKERFLLRQLCLLFATVMLLTVAVFAWFVNNQTSTASGINVTMGTSKNLMISLDDGATYHGGLDLLSESSQSFISENNKIKGKLSMQDITSDGYTFWRPVFTQTDNIRTPDTTAQWESATKNYAYITENVKFKTSFPADIYIGAGTTVVPSDKEEDLATANAVNLSDGGNFSKDCIIGALRISAVRANEKTACFVMIPRSDLKLVQENGTFSVITANLPDDTKIHEYYTTNSNANEKDNYVKKTNSSPLLSFTTTEGNAGSENEKIATTTLADDGYYYATATVNVWLEGCDAETRRVLSGGKYNIILDFVAIEIES